jgi:hypothetical protein
MDVLEGKKITHEKGTEAYKVAYGIIMEYKAAVLGYTALKEAPQLYYDGKMIMNMNYSPSQWKAMPIGDRAAVIATVQLENMVHVIDGYYKETDRREEKANRDRGKKRSG